MNKFLVFILIIIALGYSKNIVSQTLYIPNGTGGISTSTNSNVGIGTSNPLHKFEITSGDLYINNYSADGGTIRSYGHFMDFKGASESSYAHRIYRFFPSPGISGPTYTYLSLYTGTTVGDFIENVSISSSGNTYFNGGNVGVGTNGPTSKFEVNQSSNSEWAAQIFNSGGDGRGLKVRSASGNTIPVLQLEDNYGNIKFIVQSGGNVLVGKTSQTGTGTRYKLDVEGPIRAHEIVVNTTGADFVFESNYKLRSLSELENFIHTNKHLPDIAPAKEMQKNGVSAGEMQAKLLQKVEELTIYIIEQNKRITELENKLKENKSNHQ